MNFFSLKHKSFGITVGKVENAGNISGADLYQKIKSFTLYHIMTIFEAPWELTLYHTILTFNNP